MSSLLARLELLRETASQIQAESAAAIAVSRRLRSELAKSRAMWSESIIDCRDKLERAKAFLRSYGFAPENRA